LTGAKNIRFAVACRHCTVALRDHTDDKSCCEERSWERSASDELRIRYRPCWKLILCIRQHSSAGLLGKSLRIYRFLPFDTLGQVAQSDLSCQLIDSITRPSGEVSTFEKVFDRRHIRSGPPYSRSEDRGVEGDSNTDVQKPSMRLRRGVGVQAWMLDR
jgi:hypothetical protein